MDYIYRSFESGFKAANTFDRDFVYDLHKFINRKRKKKQITNIINHIDQYSTPKYCLTKLLEIKMT